MKVYIKCMYVSSFTFMLIALREYLFLEINSKALKF